jgi:glycosyltransferase involved in cell wall biosynthesis
MGEEYFGGAFMHVLMISLDSGVFARSSAVRKRLAYYARFVDFLSVIVFTKEKFNPVRISKNAVAYPTNSRSIFLFPSDAAKIASRIHKGMPISVITTQDAHSTGLAGYLLKRKFNIPLQVQLHGDYVNNKWYVNSATKRLLNALAVRIIRSADSVRVVGRRVERNIKALGISASKIVRFPIYTDVKRFARAKPARLGGNPVFLFVGRLSEEKNLPLLLRAFSFIHRDFPEGLLVVVGEGHDKTRCMRLAHGLGIEKKVLFAGKADPASYYKSAACLVLPSFHEGWGLVVVEAVASGCPVIMSDVGCAGELIINKKSGIVVPVNDVDALERAMRVMAVAKNLRLKYAREAKKMLKHLPSEKETVKMLVDSWRKMV